MTIKPPRPAWNPYVVIMSAFPFAALAWVLMGNKFTSDLSTKLHIVTLISVFYAITLVVLYAFESSDSAVISDWQYLQIYKKDKLISEHKLVDIKEIVAKNIKQNAERPWYEIAVQKHSGEYNVLLKSEFMYSRKQWDLFSDKLAAAIEKPVRIECWAEDYDGKLLLISAGDNQFYQGKLFRITFAFTRLLPLIIMFTGSVLTRYTGRIYLFFLMSVLLSMTVTYLQTIRTERYKNAKARRELSAFYGLFITLPFSLLSLFFFFLFLIYGGNFEEIFKLLK